MTDEEFIVSRAEMGWSRTMVRETLGISAHKFKAICDTMPHVKWPPAGHMTPAKLEFNRSRTGVKASEGKAAALAKGRDTLYRKRSTKCGSLLMPVPDLCKTFQEYVEVTPSQVRRRLKTMNIYDALFTPPMASAVVYKHGHFSKSSLG